MLSLIEYGRIGIEEHFRYLLFISNDSRSFRSVSLRTIINNRKASFRLRLQVMMDWSSE